ncbi:thiolase family protein [Oceanobacter kriegii]|uniref:thiolase family protein n=1 Tax=Oceanobacter kriegii TaxID=64972 RepID=UPI00041ED818|nr:thiolase family protein [Oceanobacter kriegii]
MNAFAAAEQGAMISRYDDIWLVDGARTPFADYTGVLRDVSPTDLGIYATRALLDKVGKTSGLEATDVDFIVAGNVAQASYDAFFMPRHIGLYAGVPQSAPSVLVHRLCGTGFEAILTAADQITLGKAKLAMVVGTESMSRNPIAAYTHRAGFRMGQVEFKDFLWEATIDTAPNIGMGHTAENLAVRYGISREDVDAYAARSFANAVAAQQNGYFDDEVVAVVNSEWTLEGYQPRKLKLADRAASFDHDGHVRPTSLETLAKLRPAFRSSQYTDAYDTGVQTGGNSSAIVDGAAAVLVVSGDYMRAHGLKPLARIAGGSVVGVPPEIMGIGPAPAIRSLLNDRGMSVNDVCRYEINEAFGAQVMACERELGLDRERLNIHGGAIAIGHPLGVTGVRLTHTVARQLNQTDGQFAISSACAGGGQGIAVLLEKFG